MKNCAGLFAAVSSKDVSQVAAYLKSNPGCPVNTVNENGQTALYVCAEFADPSIAVCLLGKGADVNIAEPSGYTPLHLATFLGHVNTVAALLRGGTASVDKQTSDGSSALHLAAANMSLPLVKLLVEAGSDLLLKDLEGKLPIQVVPDQNDAVFAYLKKCLIDLKNKNSSAPQGSSPPTSANPAENEKLMSAVRLLQSNLAKERGRVAQLEDELRAIREDTIAPMCRSCSAEAVAVLLLPCSHVHFCKQCAAPMVSCATCETPIVGKIPAVV